MASNPERRSASERLRGLWLGGGAPVGSATGPWWRLTGVRRYRRSGSPNLIRPSPMASWRRGDLDPLTLGWQRMVVAASDGEVTRRKLGIIGGGLRSSSG
jgi:hypothetical protein